MTTTQRVWAGETPFDKERKAAGMYAALERGQVEGYRAAMNSEVAWGLYEALHEMAGQFLEEGSVGWRKRMTDSVKEALAAYEKGLR